MELDTQQRKANVVEFDVEGVGHFTALKEPTAPVIYFAERAELAAIVGGQVQLAEMESVIEKYKETSDEIKQLTVLKCMAMLTDAQTYITLKKMLIRTPEGFNFDRDFAKVGEAFNTARGLFRTGDNGQTQPSSQSTESSK